MRRWSATGRYVAEVVSRRLFLLGGPAAVASLLLLGCSEDAQDAPNTSGESAAAGPLAATPTDRWAMPAEETKHERTWMCWPGGADIWGDTLADVQATIVDVAVAIARYEPVTMLVQPKERAAASAQLGPAIELLDAPVDDLWARDCLPNFLIRRNPDGSTALAAGHATFNGWGAKQRHASDTQLARFVADHLGVELFESGLTGEGGAIEIDGAGTVLAARSCWINRNRNPGADQAQVEAALLTMLGADRMIWVDGLAGHDITDGHIRHPGPLRQRDDDRGRQSSLRRHQGYLGCSSEPDKGEPARCQDP